jgi:hypothetical protein
MRDALRLDRRRRGVAAFGDGFQDLRREAEIVEGRLGGSTGLSGNRLGNRSCACGFFKAGFRAGGRDTRYRTLLVRGARFGARGSRPARMARDSLMHCNIGNNC